MHYTCTYFSKRVCILNNTLKEEFFFLLKIPQTQRRYQVCILDNRQYAERKSEIYAHYPFMRTFMH